MPRINPDWTPPEHAFELMRKWVWRQEKIACKPFSDQQYIDAFCDSLYESFMLYWIDTKESKKSWSSTWLNWMRRNWENGRHRRNDAGSNGFFNIADVTTDKPKPAIKQRYKIPERPKTPDGPTNPLEALKIAKQSIKRTNYFK